MALEGELQAFLRRTTEGAYRLETADGSLILQRPTYREVRADLEKIVKMMVRPPRKVTVLVGSSRRPPSRAVPPVEVHAQVTPSI